MNDLKALRKQIDEKDNIISSSIAERLDLSEKIAFAKMKSKTGVSDPKRENEILKRITEALDPEDAREISFIYSVIFMISRFRQSEINYAPGSLARRLEEAVKYSDFDLPSVTRVCCQGLPGANSHNAAMTFFNDPEVEFEKTFDGVVEKVISGECEYGVLPFENSIRGTIDKTYDLINHADVTITAMANVRINHCLLAKKGTGFGDIGTVLSHPQAISQCSGFLQNEHSLKTQTVENTAVAARIVSESGSKDIAAIASPECADIYGLDIIKNDISDFRDNYTKFALISKGIRILNKSSTVTITFCLPNKPKAMYDFLSRMEVLDLNFTRIESRPVPGNRNQYVFFLDIEISEMTEELIKVLDMCSKELESFEFIGYYEVID